MSLLSQLCPFALGCNVVTLGIIFTLLLLLLDFMKRRKPCTDFPPSPPSWPFVGNLLQMDFRDLHNSFKQLSKQYGDVMSLRVFWKPTVVLNGFEVIKEALIQKSEDTADRPPFNLYEILGFVGNNKAVVLANYGQSWKDLRRFTLSTLRDFGMGKKSLEERVRDEAGYLCDAFQSEQGGPFDPHVLINTAVSNVICSIIFGERFEYDDHKFLKLLCLIEESIKAESGPVPQIISSLPWSSKVPGLARLFFQPRIHMLQYLQEIINEHKQTWDSGHTRDFIDAFMLEMKKAKGVKDSNFNDQNLLLIIADLFAAGTETTTTTLRWGLLFMLLYPDVQRKVQEEIDQVIGRTRKPTMGDVLQMPYTNAVIHEIQRYADIIPLSVPHMTYRDTHIKGFFIPKGTVIMTNLSSVLKDEKVWEKPFQFYPEHFIDRDGKFVKREAFMAFSAGRRVCLGEQLARMELFLFFSSLLQRFSFQIPDGEPCPREDPEFVYMQFPHRYKICAKVR
uniref:Cytochrome P450 family 2 subfamily D member 6 n=1 Tax=Xenopus tropicalis TaxID=8364 RepID=A0A7D9NK76_XENTR